MIIALIVNNQNNNNNITSNSNNVRRIIIITIIVTLPRLPPTHLEDSFVAGLAGWLAEVKPNQSYLTCLEGSGRSNA